ncbi:MAG: GntR family transcriptional regulator [Planctomycetales bacterium]|nr:GntR family transcriptional regulator [Planctomycetales bacterium]
MSDAFATTVDRVAAQLLGDIRRRGLRPGDRYFTAAEASKMFDVGSMTVHRAMTSLAEQEILIRQRSRGTFVGPGYRRNNEPEHGFEVLHLAMAMDYHRSQTVSSDALVDEFAQALPGIAVQVHHLVESGAERYIDRTLSRIADEGREGFVLVRCARRVQLLTAESKLPAVVFGQTYPDVRLPCLKHDQGAIGRLMVEHALAQGAQRFSFLTHAHWRYGDHQMIDAATAALASAGVPLDSVRLRSLPPEREIVAQVVEESLNESVAPHALLCRNDFYANTALEIAERCATDVCIVSGAHAPPGPAVAFPRIVARWSLRQQIDQLVQMLCDGPQEAADPGEIVIPVELVAADSSAPSRVSVSKKTSRSPRRSTPSP